MKNKRGQFYLLTTIVIVTLIAAFVTISNYSQKKPSIKINYIGEELGIESESVIDYGIENGENRRDLLTDFTQKYSAYSEVDNFYYIFGDTSSLRVSGYRKLSDGSFSIDTSGSFSDINLPKGEYVMNDYSNTNANIRLKIDDIEYPFTLNEGENFYFVVSDELEGERHIYSNG